jgi:predicted enzyme related to lactoylglutathione lyase
MNHTIVHFEIPASNPEKVGKFYSGLFGWKINKMPGPMDYWGVETAPEGQGVNGGIARRSKAEDRPTNYILVDSVQEYESKVKKLGGKVVVSKEEVPEMGYFAIVLDPDGNAFGLWEPMKKG